MKHTILDFEAMIESVRKDGRIHDYKIEELEVYEDYLYYRRRYVDHKFHEAVEYNLFPKENIGIYRLFQKKHSLYSPSETYHYYVDMVSVTKDKCFWRAKDLYIDFIIKKDGKYYVVDIDEFNDAVSRKELDDGDIKNALNGLDNVLKGYYVNHDMEYYISSLKGKYKNSEKLVFKSKRG